MAGMVQSACQRQNWRVDERGNLIGRAACHCSVRPVSLQIRHLPAVISMTETILGEIGTYLDSQ